MCDTISARKLAMTIEVSGEGGGGVLSPQA
jgi:hypothetical protein